MSALSLASSLGEVEVEENVDTDDIHEIEETTQRKPRIRRIRLKKSYRPTVRERQDVLLPGWILGKDLCLPFYIGRHCKKDRNVSFLPVERMLSEDASTVTLDNFCVKNT